MSHFDREARSLLAPPQASVSRETTSACLSLKKGANNVEIKKNMGLLQHNIIFFRHSAIL